MAQPLLVPYHAQNDEGFCLAACSQMVLAYQGIHLSQDRLAQILRIQPGLGTASRNVQRLASNSLAVVYGGGSLETIQNWLIKGLPIIVFVQAGELSHWFGQLFQHAVVVVGMDRGILWLLDPEFGEQPVSVSIDEFLLAWGEMDYLFAVLQKGGK